MTTLMKRIISMFPVMSAFLKVFISAVAMSAASSGLATASYNPDQACQDQEYTLHGVLDYR